MKAKAIKDPDAAAKNTSAKEALKRLPGGLGGLKWNEEALLTVRKQFKETGAFARWGKPEEKIETIDVLGFVTEPAGVNVKLGVTIGLENYGSARIDVGCYMPCYREEMPEAYKTAKNFVAERVITESEEVKAFQRTGKFFGAREKEEAKGSDKDSDYEF